MFICKLPITKKNCVVSNLNIFFSPVDETSVPQNALLNLSEIFLWGVKKPEFIDVLILAEFGSFV
jgi:hypothetical protein